MNLEFKKNTCFHFLKSSFDKKSGKVSHIEVLPFGQLRKNKEILHMFLPKIRNYFIQYEASYQYFLKYEMNFKLCFSSRNYIQ